MAWAARMAGSDTLPELSAGASGLHARRFDQARTAGFNCNSRFKPVILTQIVQRVQTSIGGQHVRHHRGSGRQPLRHRPRADARRRLDTGVGRATSCCPSTRRPATRSRSSRASAAAALAIVLAHSRGRDAGASASGSATVRTPLPDAARKATGPAFIAARDAVERAKRADARFALRAPPTPSSAPTIVEPLVQHAPARPAPAARTRAGRSTTSWRAGRSPEGRGCAYSGSSAAAVSHAPQVPRCWSVEDDARPGARAASPGRTRCRGIRQPTRQRNATPAE